VLDVSTLKIQLSGSRERPIMVSSLPNLALAQLETLTGKALPVN